MKGALWMLCTTATLLGLQQNGLLVKGVLTESIIGDESLHAFEDENGNVFSSPDEVALVLDDDHAIGLIFDENVIEISPKATITSATISLRCSGPTGAQPNDVRIGITTDVGNFFVSENDENKFNVTARIPSYYASRDFVVAGDCDSSFSYWNINVTDLIQALVDRNDYFTQPFPPAFVIEEIETSSFTQRNFVPVNNFVDKETFWPKLSIEWEDTASPTVSPTVSPTLSPTTNPTGAPTQSPISSRPRTAPPTEASKDTTIAIVGGIVGGSVFLVGLGLFCFQKSRQSSAKNKQADAGMSEKLKSTQQKAQEHATRHQSTKLAVADVLSPGAAEDLV